MAVRSLTDLGAHRDLANFNRKEFVDQIFELGSGQVREAAHHRIAAFDDRRKRRLACDLISKSSSCRG